MITNELRSKFNNEFGLNPWPESYKVDAETYGNVCQSVFDWAIQIDQVLISEEEKRKLVEIAIAIGPNNGIMFKNVELIIEK